MKKLLVLFIALSTLLIYTGCKKDDPKPVDVVTLDIKDITSTSAWVGVRVDNIPSCSVGSKRYTGVVWGLSPVPTISNNKKSSPEECVGGTSIEIKGLNSKVKYYVRGFHDMPDGTIAYGNELTFTTL